MPVYSYRCTNTDCGVEFDRSLPMSLYDQQQNCSDCGTEANKMVSNVGFILKGDGWTGKNMRIKRQMSSKNRRLATKENEMKRDAPNVSLAPNVDGERVGSWAEARKLAASQGKNTASYDSYVRKEKRGLK